MTVKDIDHARVGELYEQVQDLFHNESVVDVLATLVHLCAAAMANADDDGRHDGRLVTAFGNDVLRHIDAYRGPLAKPVGRA